MPWTGKSFKKHNKSLSPSGADKASHIANAILQKSGDEGLAIAVANKKVAGMRKRGRISDKAAARRGFDPQDPPRDVDAATR